MRKRDGPGWPWIIPGLKKLKEMMDRETIISTGARIIQLIIFLYLFLFSISLMGASLKMFGKGFAETLIAGTSVPLVGLFIGVLATSLIQSSSSTTAIVVGMVGGGVLTVTNAIPIIMGANIGTSVTNTLVSLAHINRSLEFRRSFSASTVHDFFNLLAVLVIFPLQISTDFLGRTAIFFAGQFQSAGGVKLFNPVKGCHKTFGKLAGAVARTIPVDSLCPVLGFTITVFEIYGGCPSSSSGEKSRGLV